VNVEDTLPPRENRRAEDPRIQKLIDDVADTKGRQEALQGALQENTRLTAEMKSTVDEVKDILTSFRVLAKVAKWLAAIGSAAGALTVAWKQIRGG